MVTLRIKTVYTIVGLAIQLLGKSINYYDPQEGEALDERNALSQRKTKQSSEFKQL